MNRRTVGIIAAAFAVFAAVGIGLGVWLATGWATEANGRHAQSCETRFGTTCDSIPLDELERAFDVDLPAGTVVLESSYQQFQDWNLSATFTMTDSSFELPAVWSEEGPDAEGVTRTAVFSDDGGETRTLTLTMSTS